MWRCRAARQSWICLSHPMEMEKRHSLYLSQPPAVLVSCHHPSLLSIRAACAEPGAWKALRYLARALQLAKPEFIHQQE